LPRADSVTILTWIDDFRAAGFTDLVISGGEPTLDRSLPDYIRHAKSIGFQKVGIESNAIQMAKEGFAQRLHAAGLDCALVSLHSPDAAVSDAETRAPGTHVRTVVGIRNLLDAGVEVILNVLMTPRTLPTLHAWPGFAASHFGGTSLLRQIIFSIPCKPFDTALAADVVPDPYEVMAVLPGVIEEALRYGLPVNGLEMPCGPPMCAFGADARVATLAPLPAPIAVRDPSVSGRAKSRSSSSERRGSPRFDPFQEMCRGPSCRSGRPASRRHSTQFEKRSWQRLTRHAR